MKKVIHTENKIINIWVVEDNLRYRKSLAGLINSTPGMHCVHSFVSCEEAIDILRTDNTPEVILLDIGLPGISGIQGLSLIHISEPTRPY